MEDLHKAGGIPALVKYLLKNTDLIDGTQMTVTGKTLAENYADAVDLDFVAHKVVRPLDNPIKNVRVHDMIETQPSGLLIASLIADWTLDDHAR